MSSFRFSILSPGGKVFEGDADYVSAPGVMGRFGVLPHHATMIAAVQPGLTTVRQQDVERPFFTGNGLLEVTRTEVIMLVEEGVSVESNDQVKELVEKRAQPASKK
ncbi:MAG: F0F1 ATP synthase subunit epsilon [Verrucomicrobia bacterium]|nr:F0F1 ATP synthase subunit epsilon [Kiritimatiellia bacterium]MCO6399855.1 F0F1 ATP synthase subunit epsilon [Verrucomicrobiota bacterium]